MPSNIEHANISAIKLGTVDVTAGYIGNEQAYPNTRELQSAAFTSTSNLSRSGGTRYFRVTGETGATYDLSGYGAGSGGGGGEVQGQPATHAPRPWPSA